MSQSEKNTIIIATHSTQSVSIASSTKTYLDDAYTSSDGQKDIHVNDIFFTDMSTAMESINADNYDDIGLISYDGLFCPYTTASTHAKLPYWEAPSTGVASGTITADHLNPFNPNNIYTSGSRTGTLDPQVFYDSGHNIQLYNGFSAVGYGTNQDLNPYKDLAETRTPIVRDIRAVGFKVPIILTGWGYDTAGQPVPSGGSGIFHPSGFHNPSLWKSGPLDIRWNDTKKMWTAPGGGGGGGTQVLFRINAAVSGCSTCSVEANIIAIPYGLTVNDLEGVYGNNTITVWDKAGCFLNEPDEDLVNRKGFASYFHSLDSGPCAEILGDGTTGYWFITSLCCNEDSC